MAKKPKPLVAPRRPPPAMPPEILEDFIRGNEAVEQRTPAETHGRSRAAPNDHGGTASSTPATAVAPAKALEVPAAGAPMETEEVVQKRPETAPDAPGNLQTTARARGIVEREGGRLRRRRTIYLPLDVDERLERWCADQGREVSHAVAEAIRRMLGDHS